MAENDKAYRHCACGWDGHVNQCPKDVLFGFSRCPDCGAIVGTGLRIGKRPAECPECKGAGCSLCAGFGTVARSLRETVLKARADRISKNVTPATPVSPDPPK